MEEEKLDKFVYLRNIYELIKCLPNKSRLLMSDAINEYMFENIEPIFDGLNNGIWINIKRILDTYKKRVENGKKGGAPEGNINAKKTTENQPKNNLKTTKGQPKNNKYNILYFSNFIFSNFKFNNNVNNLLKEYLEIRIKNKYTLTETIVTRLCNKLNDYGKTDEEKEQIVLNAINGAWKDFYPLKEEKKKQPIPSWFNREEEKEDELTDEQRKELEQIKNGTYRA